MKTLLPMDTSVTKESTKAQQPVKVCMHVRGMLRTDGRVLREATELVNEGFTVSVLDIEPERIYPLEEDFGAIHVKHMVKPHWYTPTHNLLRLIRSAEKFICCTLNMIQMPADIYHAHDINALPACYIAAALHRKPLIFDAHELPLYELDHTRWRLLRALLIRFITGIISRCAEVITVSSPIAQEICKRYHTSKVSLIRNVPAYQAVQQSDRLRQHLRLSPATRIALYQGNIQADRGLDGLVYAAAYLEQDIVIVLMGKRVGETAAKLEALAVKEGVADRVKIIPPVPYVKLLEWTASADVGLIIYPPGFSLNVQMCLPNKLFEYLMTGLPVLSSPLEAVVDILNTYNVGRVVNSLAPADVGAAINGLLNDRAALASLHHNALEAAQNDLCWEMESRQLIRLYHKILEKQNMRGVFQQKSKTLRSPGPTSSLEGADNAHSLHL